jgi:hypothetical protein
MANKIDEIRVIFDQMPAAPSPPLFNDKQIDKFIDAVRGKRAMLRISPNCLIFTNQLLEIGDYSIADVSTECLSYRSFVSEYVCSYRVSSWPMIIAVKSANFSNYTNSTRNYEADK